MNVVAWVLLGLCAVAYLAGLAVGRWSRRAIPSDAVERALTGRILILEDDCRRLIDQRDAAVDALRYVGDIIRDRVPS